MNKDSRSNYPLKSSVNPAALFITLSATIFAASGKITEKIDFSEVQEKIIRINGEKREELKSIAWEETSEQTKNEPVLQTSEIVFGEDTLLNTLFLEIKSLEKKIDSIDNEYYNCSMQASEIGQVIVNQKSKNGDPTNHQLQKQNDLRQKLDSLKKLENIVCEDFVVTSLKYIDLSIKRVKLLQRGAQEIKDFNSLKNKRKLIIELQNKKQQISSPDYCKAELKGVLRK